MAELRVRMVFEQDGAELGSTTVVLRDRPPSVFRQAAYTQVPAIFLSDWTLAQRRALARSIREAAADIGLHLGEEVPT